MQQTPTIRRLALVSITTAWLASPAVLFAAHPTSPDDPAPVFDVVAPVIDTGDIGTRSYNAVRPIVTPGFEDLVDPGDQRLTVTDEVDGSTAVFSFSDTGQLLGPLAPGRYSITWTATDLAFNSTTETQTINVLPSIAFGPDQTVGEGGIATVTAYLSGTAPSYPFSVNFTIDNGNNSGGGNDDGVNDHSLSGASGSLTFSEGETQASVSFNIYADADSAPNESVTLSLDPGSFPANTVWAGAAQKLDHTVTINQPGFNHAPLVRLSASHNGATSRALVIGNGVVTVAAAAYDADGDSISYDWSASDNVLTPLTGTTGSSFSFDPQVLDPGFYTLRLTVRDDQGASSAKDLLIRLLAQSPTFVEGVDSDDDGTEDADEGILDLDQDGILDYLDANTNPALMQGLQPFAFNPELIVGDTLVSDSITLDWSLSDSASNLVLYNLMLAVEPGLRLSIGPTAFAAGKSYARLSTNEAETLRNISLDEDLVSSDGQVIDIEIGNLSAAGASARIVLPQTAEIPPAQSGAPEFIVFDNIKTWSNFVEDANNQILGRDEKDAEGYCPGFADVATDYPKTQIEAGDECLMIIIEDGGPNDYDGLANGAIRLMGGVFVTSASTAGNTGGDGGTFTGDTSASSQSLNKLDLGTGSGGGALAWPMLLALLFARLLIRRSQ